LLPPLAGAALALGPAEAPAQKKAGKGEIKIRWMGQSFFEIVTPEGAKIALDPHNIEGYRIKDVRPLLKPDLVLSTHFHTDHSTVDALANAKTVKQINALKKDDKSGRFITWNEVDDKLKDAHFFTIPSYHDSSRGIQRGLNGIWVLDVAGIRIAHLGDLGHQLNKSQLKKLGTVDVLMVPVGGVYTINGIDAQKVVDQIKPRRWVLPMHYATPVFDELLVLKYFLDEQEEGTPIRRLKKGQWLTINPKEPPPKQAAVGILPYDWW
jgi:L-ascorbate metabolism protein UlaG (beta-lactamase superfamily)